jgi:hypothetical protein
MQFSRYIPAGYVQPGWFYPVIRKRNLRSALLSLNKKKYKFQKSPGSRLLSHAVTSIVSSAAYGLTIVFGMGTGVSHTRIATGCFPPSSPMAEQYNQSSLLLLFP